MRLNEFTESFLNRDSGVRQSIITRITNSHLDLLSRFGPVNVLAAIDDEVDMIGKVDEIGSSDVSGWVANIRSSLEKGHYKLDDMYEDEDGSNAPFEAFGVRGVQSSPWRKEFKNQAQFEAWLEKNSGDVEVHGTRDLVHEGGTKSLNKLVKITKGIHAGKTGWIRQIKHGAHKTAPKRFYIDLDDGGTADNIPATDFRLVKDQTAQ
jgi:hypothetical protein